MRNSVCAMCESFSSLLEGKCIPHGRFYRTHSLQCRLVDLKLHSSKSAQNHSFVNFQVHGGTTEHDIKTFMDKAERKAKQNRVSKLDTVVFFDEANTTKAIGLIKEIMCDRRLCGKSISQDLKIVAACNPYRRFVPPTYICAP